MDDSRLRDILLHQVNINIRLQEFMFDIMESSALDPEQKRKTISLLQSISKENKALLDELLPQKGLLG